MAKSETEPATDPMRTASDLPLVVALIGVEEEVGEAEGTELGSTELPGGDSD